MAKVESESFKNFMHSKQQKHRYLHYLIKQSKNRRRTWNAYKGKRFRPHELRKFLKSDVSCEDIFPYCAKLLYFLSVF